MELLTSRKHGPDGATVDIDDYRIIRIRPLAGISQGLRKAELHAIAEEAVRILDGSPEVASAHPVGVRTTLAFAQDPTAEDFAIRLVRHVTSAVLEVRRVVILDLNIERSHPRYGVLDILLARALYQIMDFLTPDQRIIVLCPDDLPDPMDDLSIAMAEVALRRNVLAVAPDGRVQPKHEPELSRMLSSKLARSGQELRDIMTDRLLRRRGIFGADENSDDLYMFNYSAELCESELESLLLQYFADPAITHVAYASTPQWFAKMVSKVAYQLGKDPYPGTDLDTSREPQDEDDASALMSLNAALVDSESQWAIVVPALRSGNGMARLRRLVTSRGGTPSRHLSIMVDKPRTSSARDHAGFSSLDVSLHATPAQVDYFVAVDLTKVDKRHWFATAARMLGEIESIDSRQLVPSRVAMWSLLSEIGADVETHVPAKGTRRSRKPVRHFPRFGRLDPYDSLWLAKALLDMICSVRDIDLETLLIVMPDDQNGSRLIAEAMQEHLPVAALVVPREVIQGRELLDTSLVSALDEFMTMDIAVIDESTVTYGTLDRIASVVEGAIQRTPRTRAVVADLGGREPGEVLSLVSWTPTRWGKGST